MNKVKRYVRSKDGNMVFLAVIIMTVIIFVALAIYIWCMLYTNYYGAQVKMERAMTSAVQEYMIAYEVKDVIVRVDPNEMQEIIAINMIDNGFTAQGNGYALVKDDYTTYSIKDVDISGTSEYVTISGTFEMNMPWGFAKGIVWRTPISATSRLMFISRAE